MSTILNSNGQPIIHPDDVKLYSDAIKNDLIYNGGQSVNTKGEMYLVEGGTTLGSKGTTTVESYELSEMVVIGERIPGSRISYAERFNSELKNFNDGYKIKNVVEEDMILVQYHSEAAVGEGRSLKFWTTAQEANKFSTVEEYMDSMGLLSEWGGRGTVSVAKVPAGTQVKYAEGTARAQNSIMTDEKW